MRQDPLDRNKKPIAVGDSVKVVEIPARLPQGLPNEDQIAIYEQIGKELIIQGFNQDGHAELEFVDSSGYLHTIWIEPQCLMR